MGNDSLWEKSLDHKVVALSLSATVDQIPGTLKITMAPLTWRGMFRSFPKRGIWLQSEIASKVYTVLGYLISKKFLKG